MKSFLSFAALTVLISNGAFADSKVEFKPDDSPRTLMERQVGQRVEVHLKNGEKFVGKVETVGPKTVHLSGLAGMEFYDAVIVIDEVNAVIVRTK